MLKDLRFDYSMQHLPAFPKISNQLWVIHAEVEERVVPLIYCPMVKTKQESYLNVLKVIKEEMQTTFLEEQETRPTSAGRPPKDNVVSIRLNKLTLVPLNF
ncbi:hypothetical protein DSO57_1002251 [Entomophthora muscae]|uniref:Uncharacterized protein n=1 Tax=Entomophthora muscae TaxID=34485 RepID=A0ACC2SXW8_9FUNG|nr:hypothetical protein DSO57_1002251 [Entomophthora muscae]